MIIGKCKPPQNANAHNKKASIMQTCPCNEYPLAPNFHIVKLGFTRVYSISSPEPFGSQGELIIYPSSRRPSVRRPSTSSVVHNAQDLLLRNRWADQSQILCGASLGRGNDILFAASGSHDQDGRHAHIW